MDTAKRAAEVLRDTEQRLRDLMGEAVASGEYDMVVQLTEMAKGVGALAARGDRPPVSPVAEPAGRRASPVGEPARSQAADSPARRRRRGKGPYPRFYRRDDSLIKIAWSKKEKEEYEHKAPCRVVEGLAMVLAQTGANGKLFRADDILPLADPMDSSEVPSYQVYLVLAWMREEGIVVQHGRRGYTVPSASKLPAAVSARFAALASAPLR